MNGIGRHAAVQQPGHPAQVSFISIIQAWRAQTHTPTHTDTPTHTLSVNACSSLGWSQSDSAVRQTINSPNDQPWRQPAAVVQNSNLCLCVCVCPNRHITGLLWFTELLFLWPTGKCNRAHERNRMDRVTEVREVIKKCSYHCCTGFILDNKMMYLLLGGSVLAFDLGGKQTHTFSTSYSRWLAMKPRQRNSPRAMQNLLTFLSVNASCARPGFVFIFLNWILPNLNPFHSYYVHSAETESVVFTVWE